MRPTATAEQEGRAISSPASAALAIRKAAWRLIPLLAVGYLISYIDRTNVGFAALTMNADLALTATQFGFAVGTFYVGYCLFEVPSNLALYRFGARRWLARIMITWGLAAAGTSLATGPVSFSIARFLTGVCEAGFFPGVIYYLSTWFPIEVRGRAFAWFVVSNPLSSVVSGPLSAGLLHLDGWLGIAGWRWLLICEGLPACLLGALSYYALPDSPKDAKWLAPGERQVLEAQVATERGAEVTQDVWTAIRDARVLVLAASFFCLLVGVIGVALWLPQILKQQHGLSTLQIGFASAVPYLLACIGMVVWANYVDRTRAFLVHYVAGCWLAAAGFALAVVSSSLLGMLAGVSVALLGMNSCRAPFFSIVPSLAQGAAAAGVIALINSVGNLGGFFGPYMVGWLRDKTGSFDAAMWGLAGVLGLAGVFACFMPAVERRRRRIISAFEKTDA